MKVMITPIGSPNKYTVLSVEEYRETFSRQSEMMSALGEIMGSVDSQVYVNTPQYIVSLPPVQSTTKWHKPLQPLQSTGGDVNDCVSVTLSEDSQSLS